MRVLNKALMTAAAICVVAAPTAGAYGGYGYDTGYGGGYDAGYNTGYGYGSGYGGGYDAGYNTGYGYGSGYGGGYDAGYNTGYGYGSGYGGGYDAGYNTGYGNGYGTGGGTTACPGTGGGGYDSGYGGGTPACPGTGGTGGYDDGAAGGVDIAGSISNWIAGTTSALDGLLKWVADSFGPVGDGGDAVKPIVDPGQTPADPGTEPESPSQGPTDPDDPANSITPRDPSVIDAPLTPGTDQPQNEAAQPVQAAPASWDTATKTGPYQYIEEDVFGGQGYSAATMYIPQGVTGPLPAVITMPGYMETRLFAEDTARHIASHGFVVMSLEPTSTGDRPPTRAQGLNSAFQWLASGKASVEVDTNRIGLWGYSMGGGGALMAAEQNSKIASVFALAPWAESTKSMPGVRVPAMVLTGASDKIAPPSQHGDLFFSSLNAAPTKVYAQEAGAMHILMRNDPKTYGASVVWLKATVAKDASWQKLLNGQTFSLANGFNKFSN